MQSGTIEPGMRVETKDGHEGRVENVIQDPATGQITRLVVKTGHLWGAHSHVVPMTAVDADVGEGLHLRLTGDELSHLPGPTPEQELAATTTNAATAAQAGQANMPPGPHVVGVFATRDQAEAALDALMAAGFTSDSVSAITAEGQTIRFPGKSPEDVASTATRNTAIGVGVGAALGFIVLGPLLLLVGAVAGGIVGLINSLGASREQAEYLTERVRAGNFLVLVHAGDRDLEAQSILDNAGARDVRRMSK